MSKIIFILIALFVGGVYYKASHKPDHFRYFRSVRIHASPAKVFNFVDDLSEWPKWSPYEKLDPAMKKEVSNPSKGLGAYATWDGNSKAGKGRMDTISSDPPGKIGFKLEMIKPFHAVNNVEFTFVPQGAETEVTWTMSGPSPLLARAIGLFVDCEKMVTDQFGDGLSSLKLISEK